MIELVECAEEHRWLLLDWRNSQGVAPYMYDSDPIAPETHDAWYTGLLERRLRQGWVVTLDGRPVGAAFLSAMAPEHRRAEFGMYLADPAVRGKGVGGAVLYLLCAHAFGTMGLHRLCCEALAFNSAAIAAYQKVGFEEEGVLREHLLRDGTWLDVHLLAMLEDRWAERRESLADELARLGLIG